MPLDICAHLLCSYIGGDCFNLCSGGEGGEGNFELMLAVPFYSPRKTKDGPLSKFVNLAMFQVSLPSDIWQVKDYILYYP